MKIVVQRVKHAEVKVDCRITGKIQKGLLVFLGVEKNDTKEDADYLIRKIAELRTFEDDQGKMNLSSLDIKGEFLVISQFTICADLRKGRRPSFDNAEGPKKGEELYDYFVGQLKKQNFKVETGEFRAHMEVTLLNDGPVTFILESIGNKK